MYYDIIYTWYVNELCIIMLIKLRQRMYCDDILKDNCLVL